MEYANRLPGIGGLLEITKSKKGTALIATIIILFGGSAIGVEQDMLYAVAVLVVSYLTGQSIVDSRQAVIEIESGVIDEVKTAFGNTEETTTA